MRGLTISAGIAAAAGLLLPGVVDAAAGSLGPRLPSETHIAFWVDDVKSAREQLEQNPFFTLLRDEKYGVAKRPDVIGQTLARLPMSPADPMLFAWDMILPTINNGLSSGVGGATSVFRVSAEDIANTFTGSVALYSTLYDLTILDGTEIVEWDTVLAGTYTEEERPTIDAFLKKALERVPASARKTTTSFSGVEVFQLEYSLEEETSLNGKPDEGESLLLKDIPIVIQYTFTDGLFLMSEGRGNPLKHSLRALKSGGEGTISADSIFGRTDASLGQSDAPFHFYYNLPRHAREWPKHASRRGTTKFLNVLGFDDTGPLLANASVGPKGIDVRAAVLTEKEPRGAFALLERSPENKFDSLSLIPGDANTFGTFSVDLKEAYAEWVAAMMELNPRRMGMVTAGVAAFESMSGIKIAEDLLGGARGEVISYARIDPERDPRDPLATALLLPVRGSQNTVDSFNALIRRLNSEDMKALDMTATEVDGTTIWEANLGPDVEPEMGAFLAGTSKGIAAANSGAEVRELLRRLKDQSATGGSIRDNPDVAKILSKVPGEGLRGFVLMPAKTVIADLERMRAQLRNRASADIPPVEKLRSAIGDTWWTLHARDRSLLFNLRIEAP